jgi:2-dehydropantoate 2-reductase
LTTVLIIGAGAIGGVLAARLSQAGHRVAVVARGAHYDVLRSRGALMLDTGQGVQACPVEAYPACADAPGADAVFVTVKAHQLEAIAADVAARSRQARALVLVQNGIPWWYFHRSSGAHAGRIVRSVDPRGRLAEALGGAPLVPAFAAVAAEVVAPGHVRHRAFDTDAFPHGPVDEAAEDAAALAETLMRSAGFEAPRVDVRQWVWIKLLGNVWANPVGALAHATVDRIASHPTARALALHLMAETVSVARAFGVEPGIDFEQRLQRAIRVREGAKSSMLQDVERGRETEHRAILGALVELADLAGVPVPHVCTLHACMELLEEHRRAVNTESAREGGKT